MPRLSDLLSDNLKKRLFTETRKPPPVKHRSPAALPAEKAASAPAAPAPAIALPDFVAIDVETTGLDFSTDRIIEIGAVKFTGGKPGAEFSSLVNPGIDHRPAVPQDGPARFAYRRDVFRGLPRAC